MTWDFSTDPDFQQHLDWMNDFVRAEVWPLDTLDLSWPDLRRAIAPLRERVKARGLWAAHLGRSTGGRDSARSSWVSCTRSWVRRHSARWCSGTRHPTPGMLRSWPVRAQRSSSAGAAAHW
jgi:hypothetical protein